MKFNLLSTSFAAMLFASLLFSCTTDIEPPPPLMPSSSSTDEPSSSSSSPVGTSGTFTDARDSRIYKWVKIGTQVWMAENLNYNATGSKCNGNSETNCATYGRLYDWSMAMALASTYNSTLYSAAAHKGSCPTGWHIPSDAEWDALMTAVGGSSTAGNKLKAASGWESNGNGTDAYSFAALPGGYVDSDGYFHDVGYGGLWWSTTERSANRAYYRDVYHDNEDIARLGNYKSYLLSVRCLQD